MQFATFSLWHTHTQRGTHRGTHTDKGHHMHSACGRAKDAKPLGCFTMRSSCLLPSCLRSHNSNNNNKKKSSTHNNNGFGTHLNCNRSLILICQQGQPIKPKRGNVSVPSCEVPKKMLKGKIYCTIYLKIIFLFHFIFIIYIFLYVTSFY